MQITNVLLYLTAITSILNEKRASTSVSASSSSSEPSKPKKSRLWIEKIDGDFSSSSSFSSSPSSDDDNDALTRPPEQIQDVSVREFTNPSRDPAPLRESHRNESVEQNEPDQGNRSCYHLSLLSVASIYLLPILSFEVRLIGLFLTVTEVKKSSSSGNSKPKSAEPLSDEQLQSAPDAQSLEQYGMEVLKETLSLRGLKCGGTLSERAARLFVIRDLTPEDYPNKLRVKSKSSMD